MFRGVFGPLVLLLTGPALAQPLPDPPTNFASPGLPDSAPLAPAPRFDTPPPEEEADGPKPGVFGPAALQEAAAYPYLWWLRADVLVWTIKDAPAPPPLLTTGPASAASPAVLGQPGTQVLFGGRPIDFGTSAGGRWTLGTCDWQQHSGLEFTAFVVDPPPQNGGAFSNSSGMPILGRPFFAVPQGGQIVDYAAFPNRFAGSVNIASHSRLWGLETLYIHNWAPWRELGSGVYRVDLLAGARNVDLLEDLNVGQLSNILAQGVANFQGATVFAPNTILVRDRFQTRNTFWGGEIGARTELVKGAFFLNVSGKLALGGTRQAVIVNGASALVPPPATGLPPNVVGGGLLATSTNIGQHTRDQFTVVPELGINLGFQLWKQLRVYAGYTFLYWSDVVRPGNQIDPVVNTTQVPIHPSFNTTLVGPARPAPLFQESNFWAQGINLGLEIHF